MAGFTALMEGKAVEQMGLVVETMFLAGLCQCKWHLLANVVASNMVPNTMAMGFEDLATQYQEGLNLMVWSDPEEVSSLEDPEVQQEAEVPDKAHISQVVLDKDLHPHHPHSHYQPEEC